MGDRYQDQFNRPHGTDPYNTHGGPTSPPPTGRRILHQEGADIAKRSMHLTMQNTAAAFKEGKEIDTQDVANRIYNMTQNATDDVSRHITRGAVELKNDNMNPFFGMNVVDLNTNGGGKLPAQPDRKSVV